MRAFILGNGPSLATTPLDSLRGETTFAMNRIHLLYPKVEWRPTYYLAFDYTGISGDQMKEDLLINIKEAKHSFIRADKANYVESKLARFEWPPSITYFWPQCSHVGLNIASAHRDQLAFARLPHAWHMPRVCGFGGTMHITVQVAVSMGYDELYLLGCDLGFKPFKKDEPDPNHFDPNYIGYDDFPWDERDETLLYVHKLIEQETRRLKVRVVNLSESAGLGHIHDRSSLEKVL